MNLISAHLCLIMEVQDHLWRMYVFMYSTCVFECVYVSTFTWRPKVKVRCLPVFLYGSPPLFFPTEPHAHQLGRLLAHQALGMYRSMPLH